MSDYQNLLSEDIFRFLSTIEQVQTDYASALKEQKRLDRIITDLLHLLELESLSAHSQLKVAKSIKKHRLQRREAKDVIAVTEPLIRLLEKKHTKELLELLDQTAKQILHQENYLRARTYTPRELSNKEIQHIKESSTIQLLQDIFNAKA